MKRKEKPAKFDGGGRTKTHFERGVFNSKSKRDGRTKDELDVKLRPSAYKLMICLKKGMYPKQISRQLNVPYSTVKSRIKRLIAIGYIKEDVRDAIVLYKICRLGYIFLSSFRDELSRYPRGGGQNSPKSRLHRLNIRFKIVDSPKNDIWPREYKLNNWIQKFTTVTFPIGITLRKTTKHIVAMFHEFETRRSQTLTDFFSHILRGSYYVYYYLMKERAIKIDLFSGLVTDQHLVNESPEICDLSDGHKTTIIDLARKSKSIFPTNLKASAWLDHSRGLPEIETNDFLYEEKLLQMPELIFRMADSTLPLMNEMTKQINLHIQVQKDTQTLMKGIGKTMRDIAKSLHEIRGWLGSRK